MEQKSNTIFQIPFVVHEADMAREERKQRNLLILVAGLIGVILCQRFISTKKISK